MFLEAINHVLALWTTEPPYNLTGKFWNISTARTYIPETGMGTIPKPFQRPHPPIVVTAVAPFSQGIAEAAARGWDPISANFLYPKWVKSHWTKYLEGCARIERGPNPADWRIARSIFVGRRRRDRGALCAGSGQSVCLLLQLAVQKVEAARRAQRIQDRPEYAR